MNSGEDPNHNLRVAVMLSQKAVQKGARFILLPELFSLRKQKGPYSGESIPGPSTEPLMEFAKNCSAWVLGGSILEKVKTEKQERPDAGEKVYNTSVLINPEGEIAAIYRKIHLFNLRLPEKIIQESNYFLAGKKPVLGDIQGIKLGMAICYDLRFPELSRYYVKKGAKMLAYPSSFTTTTGKAHWETLLKARAIENQCFVLAPNQVGVGANGVPTYGHSMIIDPWGTLLCRGSEWNEEVVMADLDFSQCEEIRKKLPALKHYVLLGKTL